MVMPTIFSERADAVNVTYDWFDVAAGAGYKTFYPASYKDNAAQKYVLSTEKVDSQLLCTGIGLTNSHVEVNFDVTYNTNIIIGGGKCLINYTTFTSGVTNCYTVFTLYRVRGGAETSMGTTTTDTDNGAGGRRKMAVIDVTSTIFAPGDILRLEVIFYSGALSATIYFDPNGRQTYVEAGSGATIKTDMTVAIPFKAANV